jgi:hypothetical protein
MQAQFLVPPMLGAYLKETAKENEAPIRACLVIAWDDHSENYLVVDRETGEQLWLGVASVQIDADSMIATLSISEPTAKKTSSDAESDDDDEDRCPVCKQKNP